MQIKMKVESQVHRCKIWIGVGMCSAYGTETIEPTTEFSRAGAHVTVGEKSSAIILTQQLDEIIQTIELKALEKLYPNLSAKFERVSRLN
jgi:hypothetical protein